MKSTWFGWTIPLKAPERRGPAGSADSSPLTVRLLSRLRLERREGGGLRDRHHPADLWETHPGQQRRQPVLLRPHRAHPAGAGVGGVASIDRDGRTRRGLSTAFRVCCRRIVPHRDSLNTEKCLPPVIGDQCPNRSDWLDISTGDWSFIFWPSVIALCRLDPRRRRPDSEADAPLVACLLIKFKR